MSSPLMWRTGPGGDQVCGRSSVSSPSHQSSEMICGQENMSVSDDWSVPSLSWDSRPGPGVRTGGTLAPSAGTEETRQWNQHSVHRDGPLQGDSKPTETWIHHLFLLDWTRGTLSPDRTRSHLLLLTYKDLHVQTPAGLKPDLPGCRVTGGPQREPEPPVGSSPIEPASTLGPGGLGGGFGPSHVIGIP